MDTKKALEKLESVRPDSQDLLDPEFGDAAALVEADADLEAVFHQRQNLDRQIGDVMQDVEVPVGLKERLLASVGSQPVVPIVPPKTTKPGSSRRIWMATATVAGVAVAVVVGLFFMQPPPLGLADLEELNAAEIASLPLSSVDDVQVSPSVGRLINIPSHEWKSDSDVYSFPCNGRQCVLVVIPVDAADVKILTRAGTVLLRSGYSMAGWTEGADDNRVVCVLLVSGDENALERVEERLRGMAA